MALYYTVSYLMIGALMQSHIGENIAAAVPTQSLPSIGIPKNVCTTLACKESAAQILSNIDENVDPCDNFYKFSCGGYINKTNIPDSQSAISPFHTINNLIAEQLRSTLEEPTLPNEWRYITVTKNYYKSCMDEAAIERVGLEELQMILRYLGGWPVVEGEKWNETSFEWIDSSIKLVKTGCPEGYFLSLVISPDFMNSTHKVLTITEPTLGLPRERLIEGMNNTQVQAYYKFMVDVAVVLGVPRDNASRELEESLKFEIELAKITTPKSELRNMTQFYNPMTINELSQKYPSIPWKEYINKIVAPYLTVDDNEIVLVTAPKFIAQFIKLINATPKSVQANYVVWRTIKETARFHHKAITTKLAEYEMKLKGTSEPEPRWRQCVQDILNFPAVNSIYVKKYFNRAAKNKAIEIVSEIIDQLKETLQSVDWMDNDTRNNALEKADAISSYVGYPDQLLNDTLMDYFYEYFYFNNSYLENGLLLSRADTYISYSNFKEVIDTTQWNVHANIVGINAFYWPLSNSIDILAGILQGVFFNENRPRYLNYGAIGAIIGHEITHAFDDQGRQFDKRGNVRSWWTSSTGEKFRQKAECIVDQYNNYTVEEIEKKVDGINTQGENIADIGGTKLSYLTYKNWVKTHGQEPTLPGLNYNPQQMFWLSAANVWCSKSRKKTLENNIIDDPHSPTEFRVVGSFRNLPEFAADFNCPIGSNMNPKDKCTFW